jgi:hypothetical protein
MQKVPNIVFAICGKEGVKFVKVRTVLVAYQMITSTYSSAIWTDGDQLCDAIKSFGTVLVLVYSSIKKRRTVHKKKRVKVRTSTSSTIYIYEQMMSDPPHAIFDRLARNMSKSQKYVYVYVYK